MEFSYVHSGPAVFFLVEGGLTVNADLQGLRTAIGGIADPKVRGVFLDLGRVTRLDCSGIGELIRFQRLAMASGRTFGLVNVGRRERRLLELAGLAIVLSIHDTAREALDSIPALTLRTASGTSESPFSARREARGPQLPLSCESVSVGS